MEYPEWEAQLINLFNENNVPFPEDMDEYFLELFLKSFTPEGALIIYLNKEEEDDDF